MDIIHVVDYIDKKIKKLGDWNLDAEEAVQYGFADGVFGSKGYETASVIRK